MRRLFRLAEITPGPLSVSVDTFTKKERESPDPGERGFFSHL